MQCADVMAGTSLGMTTSRKSAYAIIRRPPGLVSMTIL
ncbi:hypothetical protein ABIC03_003913 [Bradyrhizobium sp. RT6a]|jgi:hypothetical protein